MRRYRLLQAALGRSVIGWSYIVVAGGSEIRVGNQNRGRESTGDYTETHKRNCTYPLCAS